MSVRFPLRVTLMDDDFFALKGAVGLLSRDLRTMVEAECNSAEQLLRSLRTARRKPDVILIDAECSPDKMTFAELLATTRRIAPNATIICWTQYCDPTLVRQAVDGGADSVLGKAEVRLALATGIVQAYISTCSYTPTIANILGDSHEAWIANGDCLEPWQVHPELSPRLKQVFWLCIVYGMSVRSAAAEMCVQPETVERYRMKIYDILEDGWNNESYLAQARERITGAQEATRSINWAFHMMTQPPRNELHD